MKTLTTLKTLPVIGLLAMGLALAPAVSMADDDHRGRGKDRVYQKYDGGKGHHRDSHRSHRRDHGNYNRGYGNKKSHKHVSNHYYGHSHKNYGHSYRKHGHKHHGHGHVNHVIVHDHHFDYDPFRLMLGLHFDNIDIIYRDY